MSTVPRERSVLTKLQDLITTTAEARYASTVASNPRKWQSSVWGKVTSFVSGESSITFIESMTPVERHAELMYSEENIEGLVLVGD